MLEACLSTSSTRHLKVEDPTCLLVPPNTQREAEQACEMERAAKSSLEVLDAAVSHLLDTHVRRKVELDTNGVNKTLWMIRPQSLHDNIGSVNPASTTKWIEPGGDKHIFLRVLHVLSREEICDALQPSNSSEASLSASTSAVIKYVTDAQNHEVLVLDGVCNKVSNRLHFAQLRLHIYRQSILQGGCAPLLGDDDSKKRRKKRAS